MMEPWKCLVETVVIQFLENEESKRRNFFRTDNYVLRLKPEVTKRLLKGLNIPKAQEPARHMIDGVPVDSCEPSDRLDRTDSIEPRKHILNMSTCEARKLGTAESTYYDLRAKAKNQSSLGVHRKVHDKPK